MTKGVKGVDKHKRHLKNMRSPKAARYIAATLYSIGEQIELDAEHSITEGSISGKGHIPSLPGQPPNADTRRLDTNIETQTVAENPPKVHVTSNAPYSAALEFGTSKMAERPYMRPAAAKNRRKGQQMIRDAINQINKAGDL